MACVPYDAKVDRSIDLNTCICGNIRPVSVISVAVIMGVVKQGTFLLALVVL